MAEIVLSKIQEVARAAGTEAVKELAKHLVDSLPISYASEPPTNEVTHALKEPTSREDAYRSGHRSGWGKGVLVGGLIVLAGIALLAFAQAGKPREVANAQA